MFKMTCQETMSVFAGNKFVGLWATLIFFFDVPKNFIVVRQFSNSYSRLTYTEQ